MAEVNMHVQSARREAVTEVLSGLSPTTKPNLSPVAQCNVFMYITFALCMYM